MRLSDYDYDLPKDLIAQAPARPRDAARLLVLRRDTAALEHRIFRDLPAWLRAGDVLVLNDTRVIPARLVGRRPTGGRVELLLVRPLGGERWEALVRPGSRVRPGTVVVLRAGVRATVGAPTPSGAREVRFEAGAPLLDLLPEIGEVPLPPYITAPAAAGDYQTIYAADPGAIAGPTAGFHFTADLLERVRALGVEVATITLHIGWGTFRPVASEDVREHRMDAEAYRVPADAVAAIERARRAGGRVVACGTSTVRALETVAREGLRPAGGWTDLFITPGFDFRVTDALVTNFHLPRTTLLLLVSAFAGRERVLDAYREAVRERYRFYSFGDAMLIL